MNIHEILDKPFLPEDAGVTPTDVVITSRVRLARNLSDFAFPGRATSAQKREVLSRCQAAVLKLSEMKGGSFHEMDALSKLEKQVLVERHLVSRELCEADRAGIAISEDLSSSIMVNEEDHLRMQVLLPGFSLDKTWEAMTEIDTHLEDSLDFAFSDQLGYLTACPTNLGTGLRASMMLHLPGLVMANQMEKVVRAVNQLGIAVRGLYGESSEASGSLFQISNQQTLGEEEATIITRLNNVLETIIEHETNARLKLVETSRERIFDKIGRAFGILQNGHLLSSNESMNSLSLVRLGLDLGLLPLKHRTLLDQLFIESQPGHVQIAAGREISPDERDRHRATQIRNAFRKLPLLDFNKIKEPSPTES
ncbi:MAG: protein arginine kinase [Verrucomicrobiota bacterium]